MSADTLFPVVFLVGMEQGLFPSYRSLEDPSAMEEERRLWGGMREPAVPSVFLAELPEELVQGDIPRSGGAAIRREQRLDRLTRVDRQESRQVVAKPRRWGIGCATAPSGMGT